MKIKLSLATLFAFGILITFGFVSCNRPSNTGKRYELKGTVVAVDANNHVVTISHDEIKDYMPGMTMPFSVPDESAYSILRPGDQISAVLVVDGTRSWLEQLVISRESADPSAHNSEGPPEAKAGDDLPDYGLVNQDGKQIKLHNYRGKALLLTFIYTRCPMPDQCNLMSENFANLESELHKQPDLYERTHLLSISFDPDYDTPAVLRSYGAAHSGRYSEENFQHWEFATGTVDQVKGIAQFFGLRYFEETGQIIHSLRTAVITPDGKIYKVYRGNEWKPAEVLADVQSVLGTSAQ